MAVRITKDDVDIAKLIEESKKESMARLWSSTALSATTESTK